MRVPSLPTRPPISAVPAVKIHSRPIEMSSMKTVTVAALTGRSFGFGAMWALAHDMRVMRTDHGYFCFPEVDLGVPLMPGLAALIQSRLTLATAHTAMTTGHR